MSERSASTLTTVSTPAWTLSFDDACRLSRVFNEGANLGRTQDRDINEWLKKLIVSARNAD